MNNVGIALASLVASQDAAIQSQPPLKDGGQDGAFDMSTTNSTGEDFRTVLQQQISDKPDSDGDNESQSPDAKPTADQNPQTDESTQSAQPDQTAPEPAVEPLQMVAGPEAEPDVPASAGKGKVILDLPFPKKIAAAAAVANLAAKAAVGDKPSITAVNQPTVELAGAKAKGAEFAIVADKAEGAPAEKPQQKTPEGVKPVLPEMAGKDQVASDPAIPAGKVSATTAESPQQASPDGTKPAQPELTGNEMAASKIEMAASKVENTKAAAVLEQVAAKMPTENAKVPLLNQQQVSMTEIAARANANANTSQDGAQNKSGQNTEPQNTAGLKEAVQSKFTDTVGKSADETGPASASEQIGELISNVQADGKSNNNGLTAASGVIDAVQSGSPAANAVRAAISTAPAGSASRVDAAAMTPPNPVQQIIESINASPHASQRQITMMLNPAELGRVMIKFQQVGEEIIGTLQVEKLQTRNEIQEALPEIMASMNQHGVEVRQINVVMNQNQNQQQQRQQSHNEQVSDFDSHKQLFAEQQQQGGDGNTESSGGMENKEQYSQSAGTVNEISDEAINVYV